jgi:hypothetical protein
MRHDVRFVTCSDSLEVMREDTHHGVELFIQCSTQRRKD